MRDKTFYKVVCVLVGLSTVLTLAHLMYLVYAYRHASIIYFIAEEIW